MRWINVHEHNRLRPQWRGCCQPARDPSDDWLVLMIAIALLLLTFGGCVPSQSTQQRPPFEQTDLEACLLITIDMSGSFADSWEDRAYQLFIDLMDQFFVASSEESRVVICQLSGREQTILFEGTPSDLRNRFRSPESLSEFLSQNSDPSSSPVYEATKRAIEYVMAIPGITENTRLMSVFLSDLADSELDAAKRREKGQQMVESLKRYRARGGGLALYFVAENQLPRWRRILEMAGFELGMYVLESTLVASPQLPRLD